MRYLYIYTLITVALFTSCDKFLDVKPAKEITSKDLLSKRKGYETALGGLYYDMTLSSLYGSNLTYGLLDVLAGYWDISAVDHRYYRLNNYDYAAMESTMNSFWAPMYKIIFNANNLINTLEKQNNLTADERLVLGEAIGIRAFIHLDLFRLYGPVVKQEGLSARALPYRTQSNAVIEPFITAGEYINLLKADLLRSEELLKDDPILTNGGVANGNVSNGIDYNSLLDRRRTRFNINASTALLARVYQILDDKQKAKEYALKTLDNTSASFVTPANLTLSTTADTRLTKEIIFGLYARDHYADSRGHFGIDGTSVNPNSSFYVNYDFMQNFIYTVGGDYRRSRWFQQSLSYTVFTRYAEPPAAQDQFLAYRPEISLISLSELYFILAESFESTDLTKSYEYLNEIRKNRGMNVMLDMSTASSENLYKELVLEARRQYFGEGQLFFLLKRLFSNIDKSASNSIPASLDIYKLPVPKSELDYNN